MEHMRPSILRRPLRPTNCTKETSEEQYQREQEAIAARARRMQATEARLMGSLYPTTEVQQQRQQELERVRQEQLTAQAAARHREQLMLSAFTDSRPATAPPPARPWEGSSLSYATRCEQERVRKDLESQMADENRRMALAKSLERQQQRQAEAAEIRQQLQQPQGTFWNVGSMPGTGRLIAPEQRWMSQEAYRPMKGRPDSLPGSPRATAGAAGIAAPGGRPSGLCPPWATHTEPAAATNTASLGGSFHSRSIRSYDSFNSSGMASVLGGGVEGQEGVAAQQRRPMTAAAAEAAPRRYPWEWPGA